ncbi:MAG TPA: acyltransferase, partial [Opitutus sp.]|nr:acyltransferase [Opitutus sp.]
SLAIEEQFYLIWPLVIVALERGIRSPRTKVQLLIAGAVMIAIYRATNVGHYTDNRINFGLDTRMDTLMVGAALAYFVQMLPGRRVSDVVSKCLGRVLAPVGLTGIFLVINTVTWYSPWMGWIGYVLVAGAAMFVIADLVVGRHSLLARPLAWRPMVFIGRISYGLYLYHLPVYYMVEHVIPEESLVIRLTFKVVISVTLATVSYYLVEKRFLRLKSLFESPGAVKSSVMAEPVGVIR